MGSVGVSFPWVRGRGARHRRAPASRWYFAAMFEGRMGFGDGMERGSDVASK